MSHLVELRDVRKVYGKDPPIVALDGVSLTVDSGEMTALMGPSGSGKSTLLNVIAGLDRPTSGSVVVDGVDLGRLGEAGLASYRLGRVGVVFQFFNLLNNLTAMENVLLPAQLSGYRPRGARQRALELLDRLGVADRARQYPGHLSGGERQRVAIARALINRPVLLLADEPTGALDSRSGAEVMQLIAGLNETGQTVVLVTHDQGLADGYARRVVKLRDGRIVDSGVQLVTSSGAGA